MSDSAMAQGQGDSVGVEGRGAPYPRRLPRGCPIGARSQASSGARAVLGAAEGQRERGSDGRKAQVTRKEWTFRRLE